MYIELLKESRGFEHTTDSITQTFAYMICEGDTDADGVPDEFDQSDVTYGSFFSPNDDIGLVKFIGATFPGARLFWTPNRVSGNIILVLTSFAASEVQPHAWKLTLTYSIPQLQESPYVKFNLQAGGGTTHINSSLEVRSSNSRVGALLSPPLTYGAIAVTLTGVEGADVYSRGIKFGITNYYHPDIWDTDIIGLLGSVCPGYNNAPYIGRAVGEVLLIDAQAESDPYRLIPVVFNMEIASNANGTDDAPFGPLYALGHDAINYRYVDEVSNQVPVRAPMYRYVHRVYNPISFSSIGL